MEEILIVSGLPRSGTSLLMKILDSLKIEILSDGIRKSDINNPKGYYEFEKVKKIHKDSSWINSAKGKAIKIVSPLLRFLPSNVNYKIIFVKRNLNEILMSQKKMLENLETEDKISEELMLKSFKDHLKKTEDWINSQKNISAVYINYNELLNNPSEECIKLKKFLNRDINSKHITKVIDKKLYRNRDS